MGEKGFVKAKDVERISKEEMDALVSVDSVASVKGARDARKERVYEDEFTKEGSVDVPEELEEPEVPEKKKVVEREKKETDSGEVVAQKIYADGYQAGFVEGHKKARAEIVAMLVG